MANLLDRIKPTIYGEVSQVLRQHTKLPGLVSRDLEMRAAEKGENIHIAAASALPVTDVNADGRSTGAATATEPSAITVTLDRWKEADFAYSQRDIANIQMGLPPRQLGEAVRAVVRAVEDDIAGVVHKAAGGEPVTTSNTVTINDVTRAQRILNERGVERMNRYLAISEAGYETLLNSSDLSRADYRGDGVSPQVTGMINAVAGFMPVHTIGLPAPEFTQGSRGNAAVNVATTESASRTTGTGTTLAFQTGVSSIAYDRGSQTTGSPSFKEGDIISFGTAFSWTGSTYLVTKSVSGTTGTIEIYPTLQEPVLNNTGIHIAPTRTPFACAFHPNAIALVVRPVAMDVGEGTSMSVVDMPSGLAVTIREYGEHHSTRCVVSILYGVEMVDCRQAVQLYNT